MALADAFAFQQSIGRDRAVERTTSQATQLKEGLAAIDGVTTPEQVAEKVPAVAEFA